MLSSGYKIILQLFNKFIRLFFYGNIYLGISAVALCIETNLLNRISLNLLPFYLLIFFCTVIYYTMIYVRSVRTTNYNDRTIWYRKHLSVIKKTLAVTIAFIILFLLFIFFKNLHAFHLLQPLQYVLIITLPVIAGWYTFVPKLFRFTKIRQVGYIKPFIVGFTWAGWVTVYPVIMWQVQTNQPAHLHTLPLLLLGVENFLFFSINAIIFDIKDYRTDSLYHLKTYPVILGIRNTFRFVVLPLVFTDLVIFFLFQSQQDFSILQTCIQLIPFALLLCIIVKYRHGRRVLYYLAAVDGLVFLKAFCGITSILLLKK